MSGKVYKRGRVWEHRFRKDGFIEPCLFDRLEWRKIKESLRDCATDSCHNNPVPYERVRDGLGSIRD